MSPILTATLQTAFLNVLSNILAQLLKAYQNNKTPTVNLAPLINFALYALLSTPPNVLWQEWLEATYPSHVPVAQEKGQEKGPAKLELSVANTGKKLFLDQTIGGAVNTVLFISAMAGFRGLAADEIVATVKSDFWPLVITSLKLWPAVGVLSFTLVPVEKRIVFGAIIALGWNVYLGLIMNM